MPGVHGFWACVLWAVMPLPCIDLVRLAACRIVTPILPSCASNTTSDRLLPPLAPLLAGGLPAQKTSPRQPQPITTEALSVQILTPAQEAFLDTQAYPWCPDTWQMVGLLAERLPGEPPRSAETSLLPTLPPTAPPGTPGAPAPERGAFALLQAPLLARGAGANLRRTPSLTRHVSLEVLPGMLTTHQVKCWVAGWLHGRTLLSLSQSEPALKPPRKHGPEPAHHDLDTPQSACNDRQPARQVSAAMALSGSMVPGRHRQHASAFRLRHPSPAPAMRMQPLSPEPYSPARHTRKTPAVTCPIS